MLQNGTMINDNNRFVSVVILTYNQKGYLLDAINSVLCQNYSPIQIIISDDASDNFNKKEIEQYINEKKRDNIVNSKIIARSENVGTVKNINGAIRECDGKYIIPLACDDVLFSPNTISQIVEKFMQTGCDILTCSRLICSDDFHPIRQAPHPAYYKKLAHYNTAEAQFHAMAMGKTFEFASGAALYYKKEFIASQGLYDERYSLWEDGPLLARTTRNGIKIEMGYEILSIMYRKGGISSYKVNPQSRIFNDYRNFNKREFLDYPAKLSKREIFIIKLKQLLVESSDKEYKKNIYLYFMALAYNFMLKCEKGCLQLLYKMRGSKK